MGDKSFGGNGGKLWTLSLNNSTKVSGFPSQYECVYASDLPEIMLVYKILLDHVTWSFIKRSLYETQTNSMAYKERMRCFLQIRNYYGFLNELSMIHYSETIHVRKIIIFKSNLFKQPYDAPRHRKKKKNKPETPPPPTTKTKRAPTENTTRAASRAIPHFNCNCDFSWATSHGTIAVTHITVWGIVLVSKCAPCVSLSLQKMRVFQAPSSLLLAQWQRETLM